ncbi:hypothetical protein ScPMuIL_007756 [Solemya velum]
MDAYSDTANMISDNSDSDCDLNMGCSSSDFEVSDSEEMGLRPYQFEPEIDDDDEDIENELATADENRLGSTDWCQCGHCNEMPTTTECIWCAEIVKIQHVKGEFPDLNCITQHPGFTSVCLDVYVLRTAYQAFRQYHNGNIPDSPARHRYTAYRQLVRWCWGYLGKSVRVPLPSCAVTLIRCTFPPQEGEQFKGFNYGD